MNELIKVNIEIVALSKNIVMLFLNDAINEGLGNFSNYMFLFSYIPAYFNCKQGKDE